MKVNFQTQNQPVNFKSCVKINQNAYNIIKKSPEATNAFLKFTKIKANDGQDFTYNLQETILEGDRPLYHTGNLELVINGEHIYYLPELSKINLQTFINL